MLTGSTTTIARRLCAGDRRSQSFRPPLEALSHEIELEDTGEPNGGGVPSLRSPECRRRPLPAAVHGGQIRSGATDHAGMQ
jgi:hypothetical protein